MPRQQPVASAGWRLAALLVAGLWQTSVFAAEDDTGWQLRHSEEASATQAGTQVYLRQRGDEVPAFRVETRLQARLSSLVAVLMDTEHMPEWVHRTRRVNRLVSTQPTQGVSQVIVGLPWPLLDREAIVAWQLTQDAQTGVVTLEGRSSAEGPPPDPTRVRMPSFESRWRLAPLGGGELAVRFEGLGDPGGNLASPLLRVFVDAAAWQSPLYTVTALRGQVALPRYRDAAWPFIREPAP